MLTELSKFETVKLLCIIITIIACFALRKRISSNTKISFVVSTLFCLIAVFLIAFFPIKNLSIQYSTVEELVSSQYHGELAASVDGTSSCAILYSNKRNTELMYCPKDPSGYYLPNNVDRQIVRQTFVGSSYCYIVNVPGTEDYYADIRAVSNSDSISISDSRDSTFKGTKIVLNDDGETVWSHYVIAYIGSDIENYSITIEGVSHSFDDR